MGGGIRGAGSATARFERALAVINPAAGGGNAARVGVDLVAEALLALPEQARVPLAIVPAGSGNDLARALGIP